MTFIQTYAYLIAYLMYLIWVTSRVDDPQLLIVLLNIIRYNTNRL